MHKLITAALLGATIATPLMAQGYPGDRGSYDHGAPRQGDRRGPPPERRDGQRGPGDDRHGDERFQGRQEPYRGQPVQSYRGRTDGAAPFGGNGGPGRDPGFDRGAGIGGGLSGDRRDGRDRRPDRDDRRGYGSADPGRADRGWDQRWRSDDRYDWRGYRAGHRDHFEVPGYYAPGGYGYRRYEPGYRIGPAFYDRRYWILDPSAYRLPPAYGPYRWVRYFDDVLLIDLRSGLVVDEVPGFFY